VVVLQNLDKHSKETKHTSHEKAAYLTKFHSTVQVQWTELQGTINRIQETKHRKTTEYTETTKHEHKEKSTAGNWTRAVMPVAQRYRMSYLDPVPNSSIPKLRDRTLWSASCRCRGSHIFYRFGSQMVLRLSALRTGRSALYPRKIHSTHFC
jgi:hypothetical protein